MGKLQNGIKSMELGNGEYLYFWYANNGGRGTDNCTIIRTTDERAHVSARQTGIIASTRTSAWAGTVNFSKRVRESLGV